MPNTWKTKARIVTAIAYHCRRCGSVDLEVLGSLRAPVYRCRACGFTFTA